MPTSACIIEKLFVWDNKEGQPTRGGGSWPLSGGSDKPHTSPMRAHGEHDGLAHEGDIGKEVVTLVAHHHGVACRLGGS